MMTGRKAKAFAMKTNTSLQKNLQLSEVTAIMHAYQKTHLLIPKKETRGGKNHKVAIRGRLTSKHTTDEYKRLRIVVSRFQDFSSPNACEL